MSVRVTILGIVILFGCLVIASISSGQTTYTVDDDGDWADYDNIQDAIDGASQGDTIRVYNGTYFENIEVNKTLTLIGNNSSDTIINANSNGNVVNITSNWVNMSGFNVTNSGFGSGDKGFYLSVENCTISANTVSNNDWGIHVATYGYNTIKNNTVSNNNDYGIRVTTSRYNTIKNNTVSNNVYGIYLSASRYNTIKNNTVTSNGVHGIHLVTDSDDNAITNNTVSNNHWGIALSSSCFNTIKNNTASNNGDGIVLKWYSNSNTILNNTVSDNDRTGIYLRWESNSNTIVNNNATSNTEYGIYFYHYCQSNTIKNNTVNSNNLTGIYLYHYCNSNMILNNTASDNYIRGIHLKNSRNIIVTNNTMIGNGIFISGMELADWNTHTIEMFNTINGKSLYYLKNQTHRTVPHNAGQVILANCTNIMVENQQVSNGTVFVLLGFSSENRIVNNSAINNYFGIYLISSSNNNITNNTIMKGQTGISLFTSCDNNTIKNNTVSNAQTGIYLWSSNNNNITNNTLKDNNRGCYVESDKCTIIFNEFFNNSEYGIYLVVNSESTRIHHNNFLNNGNSEFQVNDNGENNMWDDGISEGNWWSDWEGTGNYSIHGSAGAVDRYPLEDPVETSAPEKVPEIPLLSMLILVFSLLTISFFRRKSLSFVLKDQAPSSHRNRSYVKLSADHNLKGQES